MDDVIVAEKQSTSLYFKEGSSDKEYHVQLEQKDDGWVVNFQYGRRFSALQPGTKTQVPQPYEKAKKIFDKLVAEKKGKGYTEGESGTPFEGMPEQAGQTSGLVPQLLNAVTEERMKELGADDAFMMQEKKDGVRLMVRRTKKDDGTYVVEGSNRKGLIVPLPYYITVELNALGKTFVLDGELIASEYFVFDLLELGDEDLRQLPAVERHARAEKLFKREQNGGYSYYRYYWCKVVPAALTLEAKRAMYVEPAEKRAEGIVFKLKTAPYVPGRPASGGSQLKFKFTSSATVRVKYINAVRSVAIEVRDGKPGAWRDVGNVTIPANYDVPEVGTLVEVKYLYAYPQGSLYQPVYLGVREDKLEADESSSLKYKQQQEDDEA